MSIILYNLAEQKSRKLKIFGVFLGVFGFFWCDFEWFWMYFSDFLPIIFIGCKFFGCDFEWFWMYFSDSLPIIFIGCKFFGAIIIIFAFMLAQSSIRRHASGKIFPIYILDYIYYTYYTY